MRENPRPGSQGESELGLEGWKGVEQPLRNSKGPGAGCAPAGCVWGTAERPE